MKNLNLIPRNIYLEKIKKYLNKPVIKVLIGMRRVGKSSIMKLLIKDLIDNNVPETNIIYINKESLLFEDIADYKSLYKYVNEKFKNIKGKKYLFVDEVQEIVNWEKAVISFFSENLCDIIISGSNSNLLSSELATFLTGRYVEIVIYPLTFREFLTFRNNPSNIEDEFRFYLKYGGLPGIHQLLFEEEIIYNYLNSILNTILYRDIIVKYQIRQVALFDKIVKYLFDNIGNVTSAKKIADYFKSQKIKISVDTVLNYIKFISSSLMVHKVPKYNIKGKKIFEFYEKIFINDIGLRNGLIGYRGRDINYLLENIIFLELLVSGYKVYVGKLNGLEIDFVAQKQNKTKYIQVAYILESETTIKREFGNLEKIKDNYEKIVISLDKFFPEDINGIKHVYLIDFLLNSEKD